MHTNTLEFVLEPVLQLQLLSQIHWVFLDKEQVHLVLAVLQGRNLPRERVDVKRIWDKLDLGMEVVDKVEVDRVGLF